MLAFLRSTGREFHSIGAAPLKDRLLAIVRLEHYLHVSNISLFCIHPEGQSNRKKATTSYPLFYHLPLWRNIYICTCHFAPRSSTGLQFMCRCGTFTLNLLFGCHSLINSSHSESFQGISNCLDFQTLGISVECPEFPSHTQG